MGKNLYERRKARAAKPIPRATYRQLEKVALTRAADFCQEYMSTDGWSRRCERKAMLLNMAVEHLVARKSEPEPDAALRIASLEACLRGVASCSTCSVCRGAAERTLRS